MFASTRYITWARAFYGKIAYDLATSGVPSASSDELGAPADLRDPRGHERLRTAIARYNDVPEHEVIAALGTTHAVWLAYVSLLSVDDEVLVEEPGYEPLWRTAEGIGASVRRFERAAADGYALDPARIERAMTPRTRAVVVTNLHNPTGARASDDALRAAAAVCAAHRAHLIVDEVYAPFDALVDDRGVWRGSARKLAPNVVTVASLTKCYGLGPQRVGWLLGPRDVVERAGHAMTATCGSLPLEHANLGAHAFARIGELAARTTTLIAGRRARVEGWLAARPDLSWSAPTGGLFGFVTCRSGVELLPRLEAGARDLGVLAAAGVFFGAPRGVRISWATLGGAELDEGLRRLGELLA
jgi:aspartate/methionine/tyrosine aminotransferase